MSPEVEEPVDPADELMFLCLGGGNEVGRSCHIIQYKGKTVMVRSPPWLSVSFILRLYYLSLMQECILLTMGLPLYHSTTSLTSVLWTFYSSASMLSSLLLETML